MTCGFKVPLLTFIVDALASLSMLSISFAEPGQGEYPPLPPGIHPSWKETRSKLNQTSLLPLRHIQALDGETNVYTHVSAMSNGYFARID